MPIAGATSSSFTIPHATRTDAGIYDLVVSESGGAQTISDGVRLNVAPGSYPNKLKLDPTFRPVLEGPTGTINAIIPAGEGKFIISGDFTRVGGVERPGVARVDANFQIDPTFQPPAIFLRIAGGVRQPNTQYIRDYPHVGVSRAHALLPDGKILATHPIPSESGSFIRNTLVRLLPNGAIDPTFIASDEPYNIAKLAVQPDGGVIVVGLSSLLPSGTRFVHRLNPDGSLDPSYTPDFRSSTPSPHVAPADLVVQGDGKAIFTANYFNGRQIDGGIVRLTTTGELDSTFINSISSNSSKLALLADGRVLSAFSSGNVSSFAIYSATGQRQKTFGFGNGLRGIISHLVPLADGTFWAGAHDESIQTTYLGLISPEGDLLRTITFKSSLDFWGFGSASNSEVLVSVDPGISEAAGARIIAQSGLTVATARADTEVGITTAIPASGGQWYVAGDFTWVNGVRQNRLARLKPDGALDTAFAVATGFDHAPINLLEQPDGGLLVNGNFSTYQQTAVPTFLRLKVDGMLDDTFTASFSLTPIVGPMVLMRDGRILVNNAWAYRSNGTRDTTFSVDNTRSLFQPTLLPNGNLIAGGYTGGFMTPWVVELWSYGANRKTVQLTNVSYHGSVAVQPDGKVLVGGTDASARPKIFRLDANLVLDSTFGSQVFPDWVRGHTVYRGPQQLIPLEDGRVLLNDAYGFTRLTAAGALDPTFEFVNVLGIDEGREVPSGTSLMAVLDDGRIMLGHDVLNIDGFRRRGLVLFSDASVPKFLVSPRDQAVSANERAIFSAVVSAEASVSYQWFKDGAPIEGATKARYEVLATAAGDVGSYSVAATSSGQTARSAGATLSVGVAAPPHSADSNGDRTISLSELTRLIYLYNTRQSRVRTGGYKVDAAGEDGFAQEPSRGERPTALPRYHSADTNKDGYIQLSELTRVIELYNSRIEGTRTGAYRTRAGTEDGFEPVQ